VFAPRVHQLVRSTEDDPSLQRQELTGLFTKVGRIQCAILGLVALGLVFFGRPFVDLWAGSGYEDGFYVALLLILPATVALMQNLGIEIQRAQNNHQFRSIAYICMAVLNLGMTIFLCQWYGAIGAAIGTAISLLLANGLVMNIFYHKRCRINMLHFWKNILRMAIGLLPAITLGVGLLLFVDITNFLALAGGILLYTLVYCGGMWLLGLNAYEKDLIKKPLAKLLKR
jgi:O-antigen/teichoic acid export membrane protein